MSGELFTKVHLALTGVLSLQKNGRDLNDALKVLHLLLQDARPSVSPSEWGAVRSATVLALRVAVDEMMRSASYRQHRDGVCQLVHTLFDAPEEGDVCSLQWSPHIRPLLMAVLSDITGDNNSVDLAVQAVHSILQFTQSKDVFLSELFSVQSTPLFGKIVSICLEVTSQANRNTATRIQCISCIGLLISARGVASLSVVLPGLSSQLLSSLTKSSTENADLLVATLKVLFLAIHTCLSDTSLDGDDDPDSFPSTSTAAAPAFRELLVHRNRTWIEATAKRLSEMVCSIAAHLSANRDSRVRLELFRGLAQLHSDCRKAFVASLDRTVFDTALLLSSDGSKIVSDAVSDFLLSARQLTEFGLHLHESLMQLAERLPMAVRKSTSPERVFKQLTSILHCLGEDCLRMAISRGTALITVVRSLAACIRIDLSRVIIARAEESRNIEAVISSLPLQFGVDIHNISLICDELAKNAGIEIVDVLSSELLDCSPSDRIGLLLMNSLVVSRLSPESISSSTDVIFILAEQCIHFLAEMPDQLVARDDVIEDLSRSATHDTISCVSLVCCLSACMMRLPLETKRQKLLIKVIYNLLQLCSHQEWIISETADIAIIEIANVASQSLSDFLLANSVYLVSAVSLACLSSSAHCHAPMVLSKLVDKVADPALFGHVQHINMSLLEALDRHDQTWCLVVLRALRSFVKAMLRWFPSETPPPQQIHEPLDQDDISDPVEDETKPPAPQTVQSVEAILKRTRHLIASPHFPIRVLVLDVVKNGLHFVRKFDDVLLPMLHQNWLSLLPRLNDERIEVRLLAFEVLREMCLLSGTFVYRRVRDETWPIIMSWMTSEAKKPTNYVHSATFKYQTAVLDGIVDVWRSIEMDADDWHQRVQPILIEYQRDRVHPKLRQMAASSETALLDLLPKMSS